ncbi:MAG: hypothetical protein ACPF8V_07435 [Luteibaculum sp.]
MEAPKIPGFFKTRGPRSFYFPARYYDERKERIQKRREQIKRELVVEGKLNAKDQLELQNEVKEHYRIRANRVARKKSNTRFFIILGFLLAIFWWLWNKSDLLG